MERTSSLKSEKGERPVGWRMKAIGGERCEATAKVRGTCLPALSGCPKGRASESREHGFLAVPVRASPEA
jgi:hypothetical protein